MSQRALLSSYMRPVESTNSVHNLTTICKAIGGSHSGIIDVPAVDLAKLSLQS